MLVSFIIPAYNAEKYISECIDKILCINRDDYEIVVINDGSSDKTKQVVESLTKKSNKIKLINQPNSGVSVSRNKGVSESNGKYIFFVDADDVIEPIQVTETMYFLDNDENDYDLILGNYYDVDINNNIIESYNLFYKISDDKARLDMVFLGDFLLNVCWGKFLKRTIITENNITFDYTMKYGEDTIFIGDFLCHINKFKCMDKYLYRYRQFPNNTVNTLRSQLTDRYMDETEKLIKNKREYLDSCSGKKELETVFINYYARHLSATVNLAIKEWNGLISETKSINKYLDRSEMRFILKNVDINYGIKRYIVSQVYKRIIFRNIFIMIKYIAVSLKIIK